jgi:hypothetical protein
LFPSLEQRILFVFVFGLANNTGKLFANYLLVDHCAFEVDFQRVYKAGTRLEPQRLSYAVAHKSQLAGKRSVSPIWRYGVHLMYNNLESKQKHYWLCKRCHSEHNKDSVKAVNGYKHIVNHMAKYHRINVNTGLLPKVVLEPSR